MRPIAPPTRAFQSYTLTSLLALLLTAGCAVSPPAVAPSPDEFPALEAAVQREPTSPEPVLRLAAGYRQAGRLDDAATLLERSLERIPDHAPTVLLLGATYEEMGRFGEARELYTRYADADIRADIRDELRRRIDLVRREELRAAVRTAVAREGELASTPPRRGTVAVFPFIYTGDDPALQPLSRALADMLSTDLAQTGRLEVLERVQVQMLMDEMELGENAMTDPETAARGGRLLGAERVVQGALAPRGEERIALEAAVVRVLSPRDTAGGRTVTEADDLARLFDLEKRLALEIYSAMGVQLTPAEIERVNQRPTENIQALLAYGVGLQALDAGDYERAAESFQQAAAIDPGFSLAAQQAAQAASTAQAARTSSGDLARAATEGTAAADADDLAAFDMVPTLGGRDAVAEILGTEGVGLAPAVLELIIVRN